MPLKRTPPTTPTAAASPAASDRSLVLPMPIVATTGPSQDTGTDGALGSKRKLSNTEECLSRIITDEVRRLFQAFSEAHERRLLSVQNTMAEIRKQNGEIKKVLEFFTSKYDELRAGLDSVKLVQQKANKVDELEEQIRYLTEKNKQLELSLHENIPPKQKISLPAKKPTLSFAAVTQKQIDKSGNVEECVATKTAISPRMEKIAQSDSTEISDLGNGFSNQNEGKEEGKWTVVKKKKGRYSNNEVKKGESLNLIDIQGAEKKKYLHVWRLRKETTAESLEKHVKNICGEDVQFNVEKIKHKTERDYSSFIIGVPESYYDKLCLSENWAVNVEYCEWIWFRKYTKKSKTS